jgi:DNA-binding MurR/RpiR family transcriptional regulator
MAKKPRSKATKTDHPQGPPESYEELVQQIHERYDQISATYQRITTYLTQNPNDVAVLSVNAIAMRCGAHASSLVRYSQSLGYAGFKQLQVVFKERLSTAAPGFDARIRALEGELGMQDGKADSTFLQSLVVRDIESLQALLADITDEQIQQATELLKNAETVYLIGQLRSAPVVELLRYILTMLRKRTVLLDASGGLATHMAKTIGSDDVLVAVSFQFYATEVVNVVEETAQRNVPIVAITDSTLSPLAKCASVLFTVPEHEYTFSRSLAAPMCLAQALTVSLASQLQNDENAPRIPIVTKP